MLRHYNLVGSNDNIGEAQLPLTKMCQELMRIIQLSPEGEMSPGAIAEVKADFGSQAVSLDALLDGPDEGRWFKLYHPTKEDCQGEVEIMVGRFKLDPSLKAACFQPLNLRVHAVLST